MYSTTTPTHHQRSTKEDQANKKANTAEDLGHSRVVAHAIAKMRRGHRARKKNTTEIGSNTELRQTQSLLRMLNDKILPALEDATQACISSKLRQDQTHPERFEAMQANTDNPNDNPYAAVVVSQTSILTTSITKLCESTVIIIGLSGAGAKLATLLTRRGLGQLILFDPLTVSATEWRHNLEFTPAMRGLSKAKAVCGLVSVLNADTRVESICCDVRDPTGTTLLAHCMKEGSIFVDATYKAPSPATDDTPVTEEQHPKPVTEQVLLGSEPIRVNVVDVLSDDGTPRQVNTRNTYVGKLFKKTLKLSKLASSSEKDVSSSSSSPSVHERKTNMIVVCCDDDPLTKIIVGELALEYGVTALFASTDDSTRGGVSESSDLDSLTSSVPSTTTVVPGGTACLLCHRPAHETTKEEIDALQLSSRGEPLSCSPASHAILASTLCQAALRSFLASVHDNKSSVNTEWYAHRHAIEARTPEKPSRKCRSSHCRMQQASLRKKMRRKKMRKVLKVGNMFAWTKKKNVAKVSLHEDGVISSSVLEGNAVE